MNWKNKKTILQEEVVTHNHLYTSVKKTQSNDKIISAETN